MNTNEKIIQTFHAIEPWQYEQLVRYIWTLHHETPIKRDLELWLCRYNQPFDPMRLKLHLYDVSDNAYDTIHFQGQIDLYVSLDDERRVEDA